jgi:hypothetical protein
MAPKKKPGSCQLQRRLDDFATSPAVAPPVLPETEEAAAWRTVAAAARAFGLDTRWGFVALAPIEEGVLLHGPRLLFAAQACGHAQEPLRACWQRLAARDGGGDALPLRGERLTELLSAIGAPLLHSTPCSATLQASLRSSRTPPGATPLFPPWGETLASDAGFDVVTLRARLGLPPCMRHVAFGLRDVPQPLRPREAIGHDAELARERGRAMRVEDLERGCLDFVPRPPLRTEEETSSCAEALSGAAAINKGRGGI